MQMDATNKVSDDDEKEILSESKDDRNNVSSYLQILLIVFIPSRLEYIK